MNKSLDCKFKFNSTLVKRGLRRMIGWRMLVLQIQCAVILFGPNPLDTSDVFEVGSHFIRSWWWDQLPLHYLTLRKMTMSEDSTNLDKPKERDCWKFLTPVAWPREEAESFVGSLPIFPNRAHILYTWKLHWPSFFTHCVALKVKRLIDQWLNTWWPQKLYNKLFNLKL